MAKPAGARAASVPSPSSLPSDPPPPPPAGEAADGARPDAAPSPGPGNGVVDRPPSGDAIAPAPGTADAGPREADADPAERGSGGAKHRAPGRWRRTKKAKKPRSPLRTVLEWAGVIGGGVLIALVIEAFLVQAFYIPSPSMEPTLGVDDRVLVNKLSYRLHDVHRGDVVVFDRPQSTEGPDDGIEDLIKRVIAVEGDTIEARNGLVYVNGERVDESDYLVSGTPTDDLPATEVPEDHVFVMGDNRTNSQDSRRFGPVPEDTIVGRAFIRVLPLGDIGWL